MEYHVFRFQYQVLYSAVQIPADQLDIVFCFSLFCLQSGFLHQASGVIQMFIHQTKKFPSKFTRMTVCDA